MLVVILRGRLYVSLPTCERKLTAMETGALQTLHRAVAGFDTIPPPLVVQFASPDSRPLAVEAIDRFAYHAAPAVACDAFQCAAKLARNALDALAEAAGPLQERDVLTACADCALRPVRFDDAYNVQPRNEGDARLARFLGDHALPLADLRVDRVQPAVGHADEHLEVEVEEAPVVHAQGVDHAPSRQRPGGGYGVEAGG